MANPNETKYNTDERTINTGTTDLIVQFGNIRVAKDIIVSNLSSDYSISVKLNSKSNTSRVIEAGKSLILNDNYITSAYLSNSSGSSVDFSVMVVGG